MISRPSREPNNGKWETHSKHRQEQADGNTPGLEPANKSGADWQPEDITNGTGKGQIYLGQDMYAIGWSLHNRTEQKVQWLW